MSDLKPCPFCGGKAYMDRSTGDERVPQSWKCGCPKCGIWTPVEYGSSTWGVNKKVDRAAQHAAVERWNTRAAAAMAPTAATTGEAEK